MKTALVIGAGPAGLMAAEVLSDAGVAVTMADAMPSVGRKFLMAGKSGLNLTKNEPLDVYIQAFGDVPEKMTTALKAFAPLDAMTWATGLDQPIFTGSTGRVFPKAMKASPLLRAWLHRLGRAGVTVQTGWRWVGWDERRACFETPTGPETIAADVTILALGGASWARLGANGAWADITGHCNAFRPANCGFDVAWSAFMQPYFGAPIKATSLTAGSLVSRGEWVITPTGIEGGGVYEVSAAVRDGAPLYVDLLPDIPLELLRGRLKGKKIKATLSQFLKNTLRMPKPKVAIFQEFSQDLGAFDIATRLKALPMKTQAARPIDEAISTAGGLRLDALDDDFMLNDRPGVFCAGEMLDWEARTGGYLINGSMATGRAAAQGALKYINRAV